MIKSTIVESSDGAGHTIGSRYDGNFRCCIINLVLEDVFVTIYS
jgi:hypothetical protein